jgi:8-oxo-dGTP diphosphatase
VKVVIAFIQRADGKVLVQRRPSDKKYGGCWEMPGGKVESGEDEVVALKRELSEELGIETCDVDANALGRLGMDLLEGKTVLVLYRVKLKFPWFVVLKEADAVGWFSPEAIPYPRTPSTDPFLAMVTAIAAQNR